MQSIQYKKAKGEAQLFCSVRGINVQLPRTLTWDGWWLSLPVLQVRAETKEAGE